jgi:hypothetical protein
MSINKRSKSTKAHFEFIINHKGGGRYIPLPRFSTITNNAPAIYGLYLDGPKSAARSTWYGNNKDADPALLPHLRSLSDILWGYWVRDNPNVRNIRYFFMLGISNDLTNQIITSCLQRAKKDLAEWPGTSFATGTDEGHALLGTFLTIFSGTRSARLTNRKARPTARYSRTSFSNTRHNSGTRRFSKSLSFDLKRMTQWTL